MSIAHWLKQIFGSGRVCRALIPAAAMAAMVYAANAPAQAAVPPPPAPEPVSITELPLPPTAPSDTAGSCTAAINPHGTGCMSALSTALQSGSFLPDDHAILAVVLFAGAPTTGPSSIYTGPQDILIKTDGTTFPNGDAWKCLTCGVPAANEQGINPIGIGDYPQSFNDGMRALDSLDVLDCSPYKLDSAQCTPQAMHIYPLRWNTSPTGAGTGGYIRELRLDPDNVHLGFNTIANSPSGYTEWGMYGRLVFDPSPTTGLPLVPRYDIDNVTTLLPSNPADQEVITQVPGHPTELEIDHNAITVGEFRGFSKDGTEAFYIGYPWQSDSIDVFAVNLQTGAVRDATNETGYVDPIDASPDGNWLVMDSVQLPSSDRSSFMAAMRDVPPITDVATVSAVSSVRNNRNRRFFQPYLVDRYGERGAYVGQQLNAGSTAPGGIDDPNWNSMADPRWSWDGTEIAYWQAMVVSPECGGTNPLPCPVSTEPGGRATRIMLAKLTSRTPYNYTPPAPQPDTVPWGTPYVPGVAMPPHAQLPAGRYSLAGQKTGYAVVQIKDNAAGTAIQQVNVVYHNYSNDGVTTLNGSESATAFFPSFSQTIVHWVSNITQSGYNIDLSNGKSVFVVNKKITSPGGFNLSIDVITNIFEATGKLSSRVDGVLYTQPANGT